MRASRWYHHWTTTTACYIKTTANPKTSVKNYQKTNPNASQEREGDGSGLWKRPYHTSIAWVQGWIQTCSTSKTIKQIEKPVPKPRTAIEQKHTKSYEISIQNDKDPLVQLQSTRTGVGRHLNDILMLMRGFKFVETLKITFEKLADNQMVTKTAYFNSLAQMIINHSEIIESLQLSKQHILNKALRGIRMVD